MTPRSLILFLRRLSFLTISRPAKKLHKSTIWLSSKSFSCRIIVSGFRILYTFSTDSKHLDTGASSSNLISLYFLLSSTVVLSHHFRLLVDLVPSLKFREISETPNFPESPKFSLFKPGDKSFCVSSSLLSGKLTLSLSSSIYSSLKPLSLLSS